MINKIKTQLHEAVEKAIVSMDAFKSQVAQYDKLVNYLHEIETKSIANLDARGKDIPSVEGGLKAVGINDTKSFLNYVGISDIIDGDKTGRQLVALIIKNL